MSAQSEIFARLLRGAINSIAAYEGKTAPVVEDDLGSQIGVAGSAIQRYKASAIPSAPAPWSCSPLQRSSVTTWAIPGCRPLAA
jgi:hypothetical protein